MTSIDTSKLPTLIQNAMKALKELHNTPDEMALQAVLGVVNFACQSKANVESGRYGVRPMSLNLIGIAPTGAAKTTIYKELMVGVDRWCESKRLGIPSEKSYWELSTALYKKEKEKFLKDAAQNGLHGLTAPIEPDPMPSHEYYTGKGTVNGLIDLLKTQPMIGLFSSEAGEFFNGHSFQGNKSELSRAVEMTAVLTSMWDGSPISKNTGMDRVKLHNRRVCMLFLLQEAVFKDFLNNPVYSDQGFTHRLLITHTDKYTKPEMDVSKKAKMKEFSVRQSLSGFHNRIFDLLNAPMASKNGTPFELDLPVIQMTEDAEELLAAYYNSYRTVRMFEDDRWDGFAERVHEMPLRIAANLAVFAGKSQIDIDSMEAAIGLYEFYVDQRRTLQMSITATNPEIVRVSDEMIRWMIERNFDATLREFRQIAPNGFRKLDAEQRKRILEEMEADGRVEIYKDDNKTKIRIRGK